MLTPVLIWGPVLLIVGVFTRSHRLRTRTLGLNLRWPSLYNMVRVGFGAGLLLMSGHRLPAEFALLAGVGDIAVGSAALIAAVSVPAITVLRRRIVFTWNLVGLFDMLMVFVTAQRLILFGEDPDALVELTRFPLLVVPTFIVPTVLITHFVIFAHLWHTRGR